MNDVDVSRQIQQMVRFIRQEAEEKANEISVSAEEEFNIEKLQIVEAEKKKIRQEYERKEKQVDVRKKICNPTILDNVVKNTRSFNTPSAQVATDVGHSFVHPNALGAHMATMVGQFAVNPNVSGAQRASVVGHPVVNPNALGAQGASVVGQPVLNPNASVAQMLVGQHFLNRNGLCAQVATVSGNQVVNPNPSYGTIVGQHTVNPDAPSAQGATAVGEHAINPNPSGVQGATIVGKHAVNPGASSAQGAMVVGEQAINPNPSGAQGTTIVGQQAPHMAHVPMVYPVVHTILVNANHAEKPEKFNGLNFTCWQQKMLFYLTTLNMSRFLEEEGPMVTAESDLQTRKAADEWKNSDYLCRNYVLNCLVDSLYDVYSSKRTTKELWDSLDHKYRTKYAGAMTYIVGQFLDYKMVDSKTVISQVQDLQIIIHEIHAKGMVISESFQVAAIIEKLPSGWHEFKNRLKHKQKEMSMGELILRLHIEEDNKRFGKKFNVAEDNIVKGQNAKFKNNNNGKESKNVGKGSRLGPKGRISKTQKFNGKCFISEKMGHKSCDKIERS